MCWWTCQPLRRSRDLRCLVVGQLLSTLGAQLTTVRRRRTRCNRADPLIARCRAGLARAGASADRRGPAGWLAGRRGRPPPGAAGRAAADISCAALAWRSTRTPGRRCGHCSPCQRWRPDATSHDRVGAGVGDRVRRTWSGTRNDVASANAMFQALLPASAGGWPGRERGTSAAGCGASASSMGLVVASLRLRRCGARRVASTRRGGAWLAEATGESGGLERCLGQPGAGRQRRHRQHAAGRASVPAAWWSVAWFRAHRAALRFARGWALFMRDHRRVVTGSGDRDRGHQVARRGHGSPARPRPAAPRPGCWPAWPGDIIPAVVSASTSRAQPCPAPCSMAAMASKPGGRSQPACPPNRSSRKPAASAGSAHSRPGSG